MLRCPYCGFTGTLDDFDCCGLSDEYDVEAEEEMTLGNIVSECDRLICNRCLEVFCQSKETPNEMQKELFT